MVTEMIDEATKAKRIGAAVVKLGGELLAEGKTKSAYDLVNAFAGMPVASMARLHDIITAADA